MNWVENLLAEGLAARCAGRDIEMLKAQAERLRVAGHAPLFALLWSLQQGRCALCGEAMPAARGQTPHATVWKKQRATFDHIHPRAKGGADKPANLQLAHAQCNWRKGDGAAEKCRRK